jgi:hypothetical protein
MFGSPGLDFCRHSDYGSAFRDGNAAHLQDSQYNPHRSDGTHILPNACAKDMDEVRLREEGMLSSMSRAGRSSATPASDTQKALLAVDARPEAEQDAAADEGRSGALPEALEVIPLGEPGEDSSATTIKDEDAPAAPASEEPAGPAVCSCQCHTEGTEGTQYCACAQQHWHLIYVQYVKVCGACSDDHRSLGGICVCAGVGLCALGYASSAGISWRLHGLFATVPASLPRVPGGVDGMDSCIQGLVIGTSADSHHYTGVQNIALRRRGIIGMHVSFIGLCSWLP